MLMLLVYCIQTPIFAQTNPLSNQRTRYITAQKDTIQLDTLTILSSSITLQWANADSTLTDQILDTTQFIVSNTDLIIQSDSSLSFPLLYAQYRVLPFNLGAPQTHFDSTAMTIEEESGILKFSYNPYQNKEEELIDFGTLSHSGSLSRGLSFGNNQNLVLNSNFNLQLAGDLGNDLEILAAITDENIPIQPEGNTQQLQEFDRIFIQLKQRENSLIAGDYELPRPNSYFMNYFKKLQGATLSNELQLNEKGTLQNQASIAISRGKFARNNIVAIEGNQGPYKLRGNEGERFIIVLSGTEKVFIDGVLQRRGLDQDYVINYDQAELRFTNRRLITKDSRIIVEFEYADQSYLTSLYAVNSNYKTEKWNINFNFFSQQDGLNTAGEGELSDQQKVILTQAGDRPEQAVVNSLDTLEAFDASRAMYEWRDTIVDVNGEMQQYTILAYSTSEEARLIARFSNVGVGNGSYRLSSNQIAPSGRVYEWMAPDPLSGQLRGDYEPVVQLSTPQQQQMVTIGADYQISSNGMLQAEMALSNNDLNRFSQLDSDDDTGLAGFLQHHQSFDIGAKGWSIDLKNSFEWVQQNFNALNPYRNAEFVRDWNISTLERKNEQIGKTSLTLQKKDWGSWQYEWSFFNRDSIYLGTKQFSRLQFNKAGWLADIEGNLVQSETSLERNTFFRPKVRVEKQFEKLKGLTLKAYGEREKNDRYTIESDTLKSNSFFYDLYRLGVQMPTSQAIQTEVQWSQRIDYQPMGESYQQLAIADEININGSWNQKKASRLQWNMTYRNLEIKQKETVLEPQETYLGRINHQLNLAKGSIRATTTYEISSGQEPKIEYNYLQVQKGEGNYQWIDYNRDSIPQINEFEVANFQDNADYVRVALFTDEFIRSNNVQYNQSINVNPKQVWGKEKGWRKVASKFSTQSIIRIMRRVRDVAGVSAWNPFQLNIVDSALVANSALTRNILFFNRGNPTFDLQLGIQNNQQKQVLTSGFEQRNSTEQFLKGRWNFNTQWSTQLELARENRQSDSEFFDNRDYDIQQLEIKPQLTWLPNASIRALILMNIRTAENQIGIEKLTSQNISIESTFSQSATTSIQAKFSYVTVDFKGDANSPAAFNMLNGLRNGRNYLWNFTLDRQLGKNLRMSISYEGRKTGDTNIVHVGRAQVGAIF